MHLPLTYDLCWNTTPWKMGSNVGTIAWSLGPRDKRWCGNLCLALPPTWGAHQGGPSKKDGKRETFVAICPRLGSSIHFDQWKDYHMELKGSSHKGWLPPHLPTPQELEFSKIVRLRASCAQWMHLFSYWTSPSREPIKGNDSFFFLDTHTLSLTQEGRDFERRRREGD